MSDQNSLHWNKFDIHFFMETFTKWSQKLCDKGRAGTGSLILEWAIFNNFFGLMEPISGVFIKFVHILLLALFISL